MEQQPASSGYPAWLPNPIRESYLQTVLSELTRRESLRAHYRDPLSSEDSPDVQRTYSAVIEAYSTKAGRTPTNARFNRYLDVLPYDRFRVQLPRGGYLNASWVRELNGGKWTVATQAPIERSAHAFLSMFLQPVIPPQAQPSSSAPPSNRLRTIVQLTPNVEGRLAKAFQYFPKVVGEEIIWPPARGETISPIRVKLVQISRPEGEEEEPSWIHSVIELSYQDDESSKHLIRHLHYLGWPDHSIPDDIRSLLQFMKFVEACNTDMTHADAALNPDPPIVVGCSAGVGRTGTYIALGSLFRANGLNRPHNTKPGSQPASTNSATSHSGVPTSNWTGIDLPPSPLGILPATIMQDKIAQEVDSLREQRPMMVQTAQQLRFVYQTFLAAKELEANINQKAT